MVLNATGIVLERDGSRMAQVQPATVLDRNGSGNPNYARQQGAKRRQAEAALATVDHIVLVKSGITS